MKGLFSRLVSLVDVGAGRVLASLGMGFITFTAITAIINQLVSIADTHWSSIGGVSLQLISLGGFPLGIGMVIGAIVTRVTINTLPKLGKIT